MPTGFTACGTVSRTCSRKRCNRCARARSSASPPIETGPFLRLILREPTRAGLPDRRRMRESSPGSAVRSRDLSREMAFSASCDGEPTLETPGRSIGETDVATLIFYVRPLFDCSPAHGASTNEIPQPPSNPQRGGRDWRGAPERVMTRIYSWAVLSAAELETRQAPKKRVPVTKNICATRSSPSRRDRRGLPLWLPNGTSSATSSISDARSHSHRIPRVQRRTCKQELTFTRDISPLRRALFPFMEQRSRRRAMQRRSLTTTQRATRAPKCIAFAP